MLDSILHASQHTLHTAQPTLHIISAKCHTMCYLHYQNHGQEPDSAQGLTSLLKELEMSLKKENLREYNFLNNQHNHGTLGVLNVLPDSDGHGGKL